MTDAAPPKPARWAPFALGLVALLAVVVTLGGPGITIDEPLDVRPGRKYVATLRAKGLAFFAPDTVRTVFADNAEHPPLGRWLLGVASTMAEPFEVLALGPDPTGLYIRSGRLAPAVCFAILVGLVTATAARRYGRDAGLAAGFALLVMPRPFAHAHFGALDTFVALTWTAALLSAERALSSPRPVRAMAFAGLAFGLAVLTKIHGWVLVPLVAYWTLRRLSLRPAFAAFAAWAAVGIVVFFAGWPWLWYDTAGRLTRYVATGVDRVSINVLYFGKVYADRDVPFHYPWFYFLLTVPIGLHLLGWLGARRAWRHRAVEPFLAVLTSGILLWLVLFSTNVPVYDGERLFLPVFPLWAILIGRGTARALERLRRPILRAALGAFLMAQAYGLVSTHPFGLSYYNALIGGLPGAERLGMELTYWGDAVDGVLLDELTRLVKPGQTVALVPTLAPNQGAVATTRAMARRDLVMADESAATTADWVVLYRRDAYWDLDTLSLILEPPAYVRTRQGVWLSGIWRRH